jgi:uncharacterized protein (DUF427 family)
MKAIWNNQTIADADKADLIYIEGNWYFPPNSVKKEFLKESDTPYTCPWKGVCQYFDVFDGDKTAKDNAFSYPKPLASGKTSLLASNRVPWDPGMFDLLTVMRILIINFTS